MCVCCKQRQFWRLICLGVESLAVNCRFKKKINSTPNWQVFYLDDMQIKCEFYFHGVAYYLRCACSVLDVRYVDYSSSVVEINIVFAV